MINKDKVLVTGGCGFVGANLVQVLEARGYSVRILDNFSKGEAGFVTSKDVEIIEGDIRSSDDMTKALESVDKVIHLAAYGSVVESVESPVENFDINVRGTFNVLNECRKANVKKIIFASTGGALIGDAQPPVNEKSVPRPISPYGSSKLCCEAYCSSFASSYGMDIVALRFANVIGPISWHKKGAVTAFMKAIMNGENIKIYGDGGATRDFLYVNDLCVGITAALDSNLKGFNPIHLASGKEVSVKQLADEIIEVSGASGISIDFLKKRQGEVERNFANYDLAKKLLDFKPKTSLKEALSITWESFSIK